jgi:hypothetical protein
MSYHICKSINIDERAGKVWITGTDNNVFRVDSVTGRQRREFLKREWEYGSRMLREKGRAAVEERIALNVLDGNFKFCSGKFYRWLDWFRKKVNALPVLKEQVEYRWSDEPGINKDEWNTEAKRLRRNLWRAYCKQPCEPKKDYYITDGTYYVSKVTPCHIYFGSTKKIFHAKKSDLKRRLENFHGWEIREVNYNEQGEAV